MNVKIYGAGSIGNHLAQAARRIGAEVAVVDPDPQALTRMRESIYPSRYGAWDPAIGLHVLGEEPKGGFDLIVFGTPPHVRLPLAQSCIAESPRAMLLEKPLCPPACEGLLEFAASARRAGVAAFVGYDHAVSSSVDFVRSLLHSKDIGTVLTIDVEFREHWGGIFKAHPWLSGPADSYLGFTEKGGGASGEHSHALHLWHTFSVAAGWGSWTHAAAALHMVERGGARYDDIAAFTLQASNGAVGRVVQDVVTMPTRKWARLQGDKGYIEWVCNGVPDGDLVQWQIGEQTHSRTFPKRRPDDFFAEMHHISSVLDGSHLYERSPIALETGVAVMRVLKAAAESGGTLQRLPD